VANPDWGGKHICQHCGVKYYDLGHSPIVCPKCGTQFNPDALLRSRRSRPAVPEKPAAAPGARKDEDETPDEADADDLEAAETDDDLADEDDLEDDEKGKLIEDVSELGEDEDDMAEVLIAGEEEDDT
jgi:uncharacterized protein (TIGR02300 family)